MPASTPPRSAPPETGSRPVVVVTGASAGVGRAVVIHFARKGWRVALLARGAEGLAGAQRDVEQHGGEALLIATDVAEQQQVEAAANEVVRVWGRIDVWVNNAMATLFADVLSISPADFQRATDVTYHGTVWGTLAALRHMKRQGHGTIVQVGSALAYRAIPLQAPYCGAKAAVRGFTDAVRCELVHERSPIHITMVQLSAFNTPQFDWGRTVFNRRPRPMGKVFQPELAARAVYWAATHRRREVWVGWPAVQAILGTQVMPGVLDRLLGRRAVEGQLTAEPMPPTRQDNLWHPVPGDRGAHGRFDAEATSFSLQYWLSTHRGRLATAGLMMWAGWAAVRQARQRRQRAR